MEGLHSSAYAEKVNYTSRGHGCGFYSESIFVESKMLKQEHSWLRNCFSNAAIGKKRPLEKRNRGREKYVYRYWQCRGCKRLTSECGHFSYGRFCFKADCVA